MQFSRKKKECCAGDLSSWDMFRRIVGVLTEQLISCIKIQFKNKKGVGG